MRLRFLTFPQLPSSPDVGRTGEGYTLAHPTCESSQIVLH